MTVGPKDISSGVSLTNKVVLIVEDNADCAGIYRAIVESLGCNVHVASDGAQAFSQVMTLTRLDVLLLDIDLPVMNGLKFFNQLRRNNLCHHTKVILTSSHPLAEDIAEILGVFAYAPKNTSFETLKSFVESALANEI
jgi:CheY-like chemotaxis protein